MIYLVEKFWRNGTIQYEIAIEQLDLLHGLESSDSRSWKRAWRRVNATSIKIIFIFSLVGIRSERGILVM